MSVFTNAASSSPAEISAYVSAVLGLVEGRDPFEVLRATPASLSRTLQELGPSAVRAEEAPGKWSINEVLQHLADSELVFGWRIRLVLAHDRPTITGYDQDRWAERLRYAEGDPQEAIERFSVLRRANLRLLERASSADLERVGVHAERGEETLAHILRLYAGHDLLHLRQLARIRAIVATT
jgi:uncharacterized damage-inducible protein DinB